MSSNIPYRVQIPQMPTRRSLYFLEDAQQIIQNFAKKINVNASYLNLTTGYPNVKFMNGPTPNTKLIALWRTLIYDQKNKEKPVQYYPSLGIYMAAMDTVGIDFVKLMQKTTLVTQRIRDIALSPNKRQIILMYQTSVQRYVLQKQKTPDLLDYTIRFEAKKDYNKSISIVDISYRPSGGSVVGLANMVNSTKESKSSIRPFKLDTKTLQFEFGPDVQGKCVASSVVYYKFLAKWFIVIDKNRQNIAMITGFSKQICLWNLQTNQISSSFVLKRDRFMDVIPAQPSKKTKISLLNSQMPTSNALYLNGTNQGYFVNTAAFCNAIDRMMYNQTDGTLKLNDSMLTLSSSSFKETPVNCIDIRDINAFACFRRYERDIYFTKLDEKNYKSYQLGAIYAPASSDRTVNNMPYNLMVEDITFHNPTGQYCHFYDLSINCYQLTTKCLPGDPSQPINECQTSCQMTDSSTHWNPITMSCQACNKKYCECPPKQTYNPYYGRCALDCNKIPNAVYDSQYAYHTKCACQAAYSWFNDLKICRLNCTAVPYADLSVDQAKLQIDRCQCMKNYRFMKKLGAQDEVGMCQFVCNDGKLAENKNGRPQCECREGEVWNQNTLTCIKTEEQILKKGLPGWSIAVIVLGILLLLAGIGYLVWRKLKSKKNQTNQIQKQPAQSSRRARNQQHSHEDEVGTNTQLRQGCEVCQKSDTQINCQGPCGHYYHFSCIKEQIDKGQVLCPKCFQVFHNGITDLTFVEQKQEIHSIADSG